MIPSLTPDQWAKIKRGWVPVAGHLYVNPADHHDWWRVLAVNADGQALEWVDCLHGCYTPEDGEWPVGAVPCFWGDHATADGLLRTARAMWRDESLHVTPMVHPIDPTIWMVWRKNPFNERVYLSRGPTESAAWLAAILAAPEHQNV